MVKIGINGFNEVGRCLVRMAAQGSNDVQVVHINEACADTQYMAYQLRYSSAYGRFSGRISEESGELTVGNSKIKTSDSECPSWADWSDCDLVIDCERKGDRRELFLKAGAKKLLFSGACADVPLADYGLNHQQLQGEKALSQACSETCAIAALASVINSNFGIENGIAVTNTAMDEQSLCVDGKNPEKWRNGRCSADSLVPAVCGGAQGAGIILPELKGLFSGIALRTPVKSVSGLNLVCKLKTKTEYNEVILAIRKASENELEGIIGVTDESVISADFTGCPLSAVADSRAGLLQGGNLLKITAWYDGVWSHASKLIRLAEYMCSF